MASEKWDMETVDDQAFENQHCQHLMKATRVDRVGIGVLEQLCIGPHKPSGFDGFVGRSG